MAWGLFSTEIYLLGVRTQAGWASYTSTCTSRLLPLESTKNREINALLANRDSLVLKPLYTAIKNLLRYLLTTVCSIGVLCLHNGMGNHWGTSMWIFQGNLPCSTAPPNSPLHFTGYYCCLLRCGAPAGGENTRAKYPHKIKLPRDTKNPFSPKCGSSLKWLWDSRIFVAQIWPYTSIKNQVTTTWKSRKVWGFLKSQSQQQWVRAARRDRTQRAAGGKHKVPWHTWELSFWCQTNSFWGSSFPCQPLGLPGFQGGWKPDLKPSWQDILGGGWDCSHHPQEWQRSHCWAFDQLVAWTWSDLSLICHSFPAWRCRDLGESELAACQSWLVNKGVWEVPEEALPPWQLQWGDSGGVLLPSLPSFPAEKGQGQTWMEQGSPGTYSWFCLCFRDETLT